MAADRLADRDPGRGQDYWHDVLGAVHRALAYVLYAVVGVHVLGALTHQWIDRQPEIQRMLP